MRVQVRSATWQRRGLEPSYSPPPPGDNCPRHILSVCVEHLVIQCTAVLRVGGTASSGTLLHASTELVT